jgi:hypothetical protein
VTVNISGAHAFVGLRFMRGRLFTMPSTVPAGVQSAEWPAAAHQVASAPALQDERVAPAPADARSADSTAN